MRAKCVYKCMNVVQDKQKCVKMHEYAWAATPAGISIASMIACNECMKKYRTEHSKGTENNLNERT